jgi:radical SAM superfamily enzyme YgiQ (UPF0313 family)
VNVLLIHPDFPDTFWSFKHALRFIRKKASSPPLGLLTVAALLPPEWGKRLMDLSVTNLTDKDMEWADCAFLSAMAIQRESAREIIARCRRAGVMIVAGGPLFTSEHEAFDEVDHFVLNEAELTLPLFLEDLKRGKPERVYTTTDFADVQRTPTPLWPLLDMRRYASMSIQFSRGCPHRCEFCNVTALFGHRARTKTAVQIIDELNALSDLGWRGAVFFVDDNFIGNKTRLKTELLPALIEWQKSGKGMTFNTEASINLADDEDLLRMMVEAGFTTVFVGIETPDEESLAECKKLQNTKRDLVGDVGRIQQAGLQVQGGFIVGFDNDTPSTFQRQIDFIQKSGIVTAMVGLLQAPPGTKLYERLRRENRLSGDISGDNNDGTTNIIPKMSLEALHEGFRKILRDIYSPTNYCRRVRTFLRQYRPARNDTRLDLQNILAFFRSLYRLGIVDRHRLHYWKLLLWARVRRPKLFPLAVKLAIYGHHFRKICELHLS